MKFVARVINEMLNIFIIKSYLNVINNNSKNRSIKLFLLNIIYPFKAKKNIKKNKKNEFEITQYLSK